MGEGRKPGRPQTRSLRDQIEKQATRRSCLVDLRVHNPAVVGYSGVDGIDPARALVSLARIKGIDIMAISDLYSTDFIDRVQLAKGEQPIVIIPGVDLRCRLGGCDDIVLSCLFPEQNGSAALSGFLSQLSIPRSAAGNEQIIVNRPIDTIIALTEERQGVVLPIRVDKTPHRAQAIPEMVERWGFRAFDLAYGESARYFSDRWPKHKFHLFNFSNAYALAQVGTRSVRLKLASPDFAGIRELIMRRSERTDEGISSIDELRKEG